jgi:hypothetical protein
MNNKTAVNATWRCLNTVSEGLVVTLRRQHQCKLQGEGLVFLNNHQPGHVHGVVTVGWPDLETFPHSTPLSHLFGTIMMCRSCNCRGIKPADATARHLSIQARGVLPRGELRRKRPPLCPAGQGTTPGFCLGGHNILIPHQDGNHRCEPPTTSKPRVPPSWFGGAPDPNVAHYRHDSPHIAVRCIDILRYGAEAWCSHTALASAP